MAVTRAIFERRAADGAARIGKLTIPRAGITIETPTLLPVVNPHVQTLPPTRLGELGAAMLITNAYILYRSDDLHDTVVADGVHDTLGFDGAIMTDSGSFQLAEYGDIDVTTPEILRFQDAIGSDVATPVDIPTPPDVARDRAAAEAATTQERLGTAAAFDPGEMLVTGPIQGSTYPDLREQAAADAYESGLDIFPVGGLVPLLNDYRFDAIVDAVAAAKRGLGADAPVHMFGAGHPMMFSLAVALGCDLFDSAAYAIYARDNRYFTVSGTEHLDELKYLPCSCPVCADRDADALQAESADVRAEVLAEHNLRVSFAELRRVKQAIRTGRLFELLEARARVHPAVLDGYRALLAHASQLERSDPVRKGTFFYLSPESARRPEVRRYHARLDRLTPPDPLVLADDGITPNDDAAVWPIIPPFGPVPPALASTYPFTAEVPVDADEAALTAAVEGITRLVEAHPPIVVTLYHTEWPAAVLTQLPDAITIKPNPPATGQVPEER